MRRSYLIAVGLSAVFWMRGAARGQEAGETAVLLPPTQVLPSSLPSVTERGNLFTQAQKQEPEPPPPKKETPTPDLSDPFAAAPQTSSPAPSGVNHHMIGDFPGYSSLKFVTVAGKGVATIKVLTFNDSSLVEVPVNIEVPCTARNAVRVPSAAQGSFKIGENESPMPQDRCFFSLNYFKNVQGLGAGESVARVETSTILIDGTPVPLTCLVPGAPSAPVRLDVQRQVFGFEKTFLDGDASFGVRVPFFQQHGDGSFTQDGLGDVTMILKFALLYDRVAGNVFSAGFVTTIPTGSSIQTVSGPVHPTLLQPFVGGLWNMGDFFAQGFSSIVYPTDSRDVTLAFNDISFGYWLYRGLPGDFLRSIIPVAELHITTPLTNRSALNPIFVPDMFVCTGGMHFGLGRNSLLTLGAATPVSGPIPFDVEGIVQFNYYY